MNRLDKLLSIAGPPILEPSPTSFAWASSPKPDQLLEVLRQKNGFYAFESALHVLGEGSPVGEKGLHEWNSDALWRDQYDRIPPDALFFAEDIFGVQFCLANGLISTFDPETGEFELMAADLDEWAAKILDDYSVHTGYPIAHEWQSANGSLLPGYRLVPKVPFILGGAFSVDNVYSLDAVKGMHLRASIARQVRDLPDGAKVTLDVVD